MANVITENFNSGLGAWTESDFTTRAYPGMDVDINGTAQLALDPGAADSTERLCYLATDCTGHCTISAKRIGNGGASDRYTSLIARMPAADPTTYYELRDAATAGAGIGAQLFKSVSGVKTAIATGITKASSTDGVVVQLTLTVSGSTITGRIQRLDDSTYLASDGSWSGSAVDCFSVTDSSISASGDCRAGVIIRSSNTYRDGVDDLTIDSIDVGDPPGTPTSFTFTAVGIDSIDADWNDPNSDAVTFELQIDTVNTFDSPDLQTLEISSTAAVEATNLEPNTTYYGRVRGENGAGFSSWSSTLSATTFSLTIAVTIDGSTVSENGTVSLSEGSHTIRVTAAIGDVTVSGVTLGGGVGGTLTSLIDTIVEDDYREGTLDITDAGTIRITSDAGDGQYDITVELARISSGPRSRLRERGR